MADIHTCPADLSGNPTSGPAFLTLHDGGGQCPQTPMFVSKRKPAIEAATLGSVAFGTEPGWRLEMVRASPVIARR